MSLTPSTNDFTSYKLTEEELAVGSILSPIQMAVLQNDLSEAAHLKLQLKVDGTNVTEFIQKEAELAGRLLILRYILQRSEQARQLHLAPQS